MTAMTTNGNGSRRAELAAFLRSRRERISPEQVGLPPGLRRRSLHICLCWWLRMGPSFLSAATGR